MLMAAKKNVRSTNRQIEMLVDYMSTHTLFANGEYRGPLGRESQDDEWGRLQEMLQEFGPYKTVEQWRTTWRDLKKKARADGARVKSACAETGNNTVIHSLSNISAKILKIIGMESAYFTAGQQETGLGEIVPKPPPLGTSPPLVTSPSPDTSPPASPVTSSPDTTPSTSRNPESSFASTTRQQASAQGQRAWSLGTDFLVSGAETRSILQDIKNSLREKNKLNERKMRRSHLQRLHSYRMAKHNNMGPKY